MAIDIQGTRYFNASDIKVDLGVARQTLWRWRRDERIPQGLRFRDGQILFTEDEVAAIREYANRLEPVDSANSGKSKLLRPKTDRPTASVARQRADRTKTAARENG